MTSRPRAGTTLMAVAIAAIPEANSSAGPPAPSSAPSASSNGCHVALSIRAYSGSPGAGTPVEK